MEAGYDYLLLRSKLERHLIRYSAILLLVTGVILFSAGIGYFIYAEAARAGLDKYNYVAAVPQLDGLNTRLSAPSNSPSAAQSLQESYQVPSSQQGAEPASVYKLPIINGGSGVAANSITSPASTDPSSRVATTDAVEIVDVTSASTVGSYSNAAAPSDQPAGHDHTVVEVQASPIMEEPQFNVLSAEIPVQQLYPGEVMMARYWNNPLEYEPVSYLEESLIQGFAPIDPLEIAMPGTLPAPSRIIIPSINVDSDVKGLSIHNLGDSLAYETPKHVVGHIPTTANPGEMGSTWLFGHLESPIAGEGNIFYDLPKIPDLLRKGEDVFVIVENGKGSFLYKVRETWVVHEDDLNIHDSGVADVYLVACVPRFVYDHRLIVTGELVGAKT